MRPLLTLLAPALLLPGTLLSQQSGSDAAPVHVAVEASTLVLDDARVRRLGLDGITIHSSDARGGVRVSPRVGDLTVSAWLDLVRSRRAVRRESTQRILTLSGAAAQLSSARTLVGAYGQVASAGPELWVEPTALPDGRVRLRLWVAVGEVRQGAFGSVWEERPVEVSTEIVVPSGTPVLVASNAHSEQREHRGLTGRGSESTSTQAWIVVTPRVVSDPAQAFTLPEGIPREWIRH